MAVSIKLLKENDFEIKNLFGMNHYCYNFNSKTYKNSIIATMHNMENTNNLEVLKFALWCKKNDIKLTMYGLLNQLPLFGIFADSVILQDKENWSKNIYPQKIGDHDATHYAAENMFEKFELFDRADDTENRFNSCINLFRHGESPPNQWPVLLSLADREISDEEVVEHFSFPTIYIRSDAYKKYKQLKNNGKIQDNLIVCEVRVSGGCGGEHLLSVFKEKTKDYPLPICFDLDFRKNLCAACGQDYMAVQILCSLISNWMWIAYGGSSNILPFFPIKIISISDIYCRYDLIRKIFIKRYGQELGQIFPEQETLIYCLPEEKDGPSRTDGHRPLPNLRDLVQKLSMHPYPFELKDQFLI
jgi:hypothetical protein